MNALTKMKKVNSYFVTNFKNEKIFEIGKLLNQTWELKKKMNPLVTTPEIDKLYKSLRDIGIFGGKILGAGGGFYLVLELRGRIEIRLVRLKRVRLDLPQPVFVRLHAELAHERLDFITQCFIILLDLCSFVCFCLLRCGLVLLDDC